MRPIKPIHVAMFAGLLWLAFYGKGCELPSIVAPSQVTAVVYTIDDKKHTVPPAIGAALNTLNAQGITATVDEADTTNPGGNVPAQYRVSRPAAVAAGLPAVVVMAGDKAVRAIKEPTEAQVLEAGKQ